MQITSSDEEEEEEEGERERERGRRERRGTEREDGRRRRKRDSFSSSDTKEVLSEPETSYHPYGGTYSMWQLFTSAHLH